MKSNVRAVNHSTVGYTAAMCLACALIAFSAHADDVRSETVKFGDLNLTTQAGVEALYGRIHPAANNHREPVKRPQGSGQGQVRTPCSSIGRFTVSLHPVTAPLRVKSLHPGIRLPRRASWRSESAHPST